MSLSQIKLDLLAKIEHEPGRTSKQYLHETPGSDIDDILGLLDEDLLSIDLDAHSDEKPRPHITQLGKGVVAYARGTGRIG